MSRQGPRAAKAGLRAEIGARRRLRSAAERVRAGDLLVASAREHGLTAGGPAGRTPAVIACFLSTGAELPTAPLVEVLAAAGARLIVPALRDDGDLDWVAYRPGDPVDDGPRGTREPKGPRLGPDAVADAGLVLVPALAVDRAGNRLGRGGGGYDRALARRAPTARTFAVVFDDELLASVPVEPHDQPVDAALTPSGVHPASRPATG